MTNKPGPYYRAPFQWPRDRGFQSAFVVLETMLQYAQTLEDARRINRRLIATWDASDLQTLGYLP